MKPFRAIEIAEPGWYFWAEPGEAFANDPLLLEFREDGVISARKARTRPVHFIYSVDDCPGLFLGPITPQLIQGSREPAESATVRGGVMRYQVCRTSLNPFSDDPPCAGAEKDPRGENDERTWWMEIPDLHAFVDEHGSVILRRGQGCCVVEIYDDFRE